MAKKKLYISHALKDRELALALAALLQGGTSLEASDILCTALEDSLPEGTELMAHLRPRLEEAAVAIILLTPNFYTSRHCLCELGAVWAITRQIIPLLVPPMAAKNVQDLFAGMQVERIDNTDELNRVVTRLQGALGMKELNLPRWAMGKKQFLSALPSLIRQ